MVQVLQTLSADERKDLSTLQLRQKARDFALKTIEEQKVGFKRFGVWADWDEPYVTLQPAYEAAQLGVFGKVQRIPHQRMCVSACKHASTDPHGPSRAIKLRRTAQRLHTAVHAQ